MSVELTLLDLLWPDQPSDLVGRRLVQPGALSDELHTLMIQVQPNPGYATASMRAVRSVFASGHPDTARRNK